MPDKSKPPVLVRQPGRRRLPGRAFENRPAGGRGLRCLSVPVVRLVGRLGLRLAKAGTMPQTVLRPLHHLLCVLNEESASQQCLKAAARNQSPQCRLGMRIRPLTNLQLRRVLVPKPWIRLKPESTFGCPVFEAYSRRCDVAPSCLMLCFLPCWT